MIVAVAALPTSSGTGLALQPHPPLSSLGHQSWGMENGLPQNTVTTLLQTKDGYLWIGTESGLARFDGAGFTTFGPGSSPAIAGSDIHCLLESRDGALWVGTGDGITRLLRGTATSYTPSDGLPSGDIRSLAESGDGKIWALTAAGPARLDGKRFLPVALNQPERVDRPQTEPAMGVDFHHADLVADRRGNLWLATPSGIAVYTVGGQGDATAAARRAIAGQPIVGNWRRLSLSGAAIVKPLPDGSVLLAGPSGVFSWNAGELRSLAGAQSLPREGSAFLAGLPDGQIAVAGRREMVLIGPPQSQRVAGAAQGGDTQRLSVGRELPGTRIQAVYADAHGILWVGTNRGLARIRTRAAESGAVSLHSIELFPASNPLATGAITALLEDREGDLWAGSEVDGLHILRDARFRSLGAAEGLSSDAATAILADRSGTVWIGTDGGGLNPVEGGRIRTLTARQGLLSDVILALAVTSEGDLWVGTPDGLNRLHRGRISAFTSADGLADDFARSLYADRDGSLWIGTRRGLAHWSGGRFVSYTQSDGLGSNLIGAMTRDRQGNLWVATLGGLSRLRESAAETAVEKPRKGLKIDNFTVTDGLSSNVITALGLDDSGRLWIGTQSNGLNLLDPGTRGQAPRFLRLDSVPGLSAELPPQVHGLLDDGEGHLWIAANSGIVRADTAELANCAQMSAALGRTKQPCHAHLLHFGLADGLRSSQTASSGHPNLCRGRDGQLWFATPKGVAALDPGSLAENTVPPPVVVESFAVDDAPQPLADTVALPAGHVRFQFDYAGLSFVAPQKVRYRYMLEGFDGGWTDAGARRTAYYTNLAPGNYHFRVLAANNDGVWSQAAATVNFVVLPHYYQTAWFYAALLLAACGLVLLVVRLRVLSVEHEMGAVLAERNRIAREIHDTLAQGYVGISVQLEVLAELLRQNRADAATKHLDLARASAREGLEDARKSIWALRSQDSSEQTLPVRLKRMVQQAADAKLAASLGVHGAYRAVPPETDRELMRIAQEAIRNVKKHAAARNLHVRLEYDVTTLSLEITDDGRGFDVAAVGARRGNHYGLTGIRERAALIDANLAVESSPGNGASIRVTVPIATEVVP